MFKKNMVVWVVVVVVILLTIGGSLVGVSNDLVRQEQQIEAQLAQIDNQYQRRFDLTQNLVGSLQGVMDQEQDIFLQISENRSKYTQAGSLEEKAEYAEEMGGNLSRLIAITESYPELKSADGVQSLMIQLEGTENRISIERRRYNEVVRDYNTNIKTFPNSLLAGMLGHSQKSYLEADSQIRQNPNVKFNQD